ncbi:MAG TPA: hypothetical protein VNZ49_15605 [Bacteroidia bacterium]|jgi:hypothetical protein|nr:hypothetical protein [Bacteroidia bacterium]
MKPCFILFFTFSLFINIRAQEVSGKLYKAQCISFRNNIYVAGYEESDKVLVLKITAYNKKLEKINEVIKVIGKYKAVDFYAPEFDTTHSYLSLVVQKANNEKTAILVRYNENFKIISGSDNAEITRINSFAAFDNEKLYYKNQLYIIREAKDSAGRFYFFRYDLKDSSVLFNYNFKWQFNFDKHTYHRIHPVFANSEHIYLYVICIDGDKKGQWILIFNTDNGNLAKAIKLNKNDNEICFVSKLEVYGNNEDIALAGVKYPAINVDLKTGIFSLNYQTNKAVNTFFCQIDSSGEIKTRLENFVNIPNEILKEKELKEFLFRCNNSEKTESGFNLNYECLYKGKDGIYRTYGFLICKLNQSPEGTYKQENNSFLACYRNEKKNPLSKQTTNQYDNDKASDTDRLFYKNAFMKNFTDAGMEINSTKKTAFIVSCFDSKKTTTLEFYKNIMKNYTWETSSLKNSNDYSRFNAFGAGINKFILFVSSKDETNFTLSLTEL